MEASSNRITAGASSSRMRRAAPTLFTAATRSPAILVSNSRRAAAHRAASSLTNSMVCSRFCMSLSVSRFIFSFCCQCHCFAWRVACQHGAHLFRQLLDTERLGDMGQVISCQELARLRRDDVAGYEQKAFAQRISRADQRFIKMLSVQPWHFHVADHQVV